VQTRGRHDLKTQVPVSAQLGLYQLPGPDDIQLRPALTSDTYLNPDTSVIAGSRIHAGERK
jgi:hypothetical protein